MSLNEYIMKLKLEQGEERRRMLIDYEYLSKMKIAKNYEFSEKLSLPFIMFNPNEKLKASLLDYDKENRRSNKRNSIDLGNLPIDNGSNEKFKFIDKNDLKRLSPIRLMPLEMRKIQVSRENEIKKIENKKLFLKNFMNIGVPIKSERNNHSRNINKSALTNNWYDIFFKK